MMSSPTDSMSAPPQASGWWLESYKRYICAGLAVLEALCGLLTFISFSSNCVIAGILQILGAVAVLAVELPFVVGFLRFAQPIGTFFDGKPTWIITAVYGVIALVPIVIGCFGFFFVIGCIAALGIVAVYVLMILGPKASRDEMKFQAAGTPTAGQPYSPTSP